MPRSETKAAPRFFDVPAGTPKSQCKGRHCRAVIYWIRNPDTGHMIPIDCDVDGGEEPGGLPAKSDPRQITAFPAPEPSIHDGRGVSHFTTCVDVGDFSRKA